jgi:hypothetical protein
MYKDIENVDQNITPLVFQQRIKIINNKLYSKKDIHHFAKEAVLIWLKKMINNGYVFPDVDFLMIIHDNIEVVRDIDLPILNKLPIFAFHKDFNVPFE